jgi:bacterial/archaeal transporter family-2 protein
VNADRTPSIFPETFRFKSAKPASNRLMSWLYYFFSAITATATPFQSGMNSTLSKKLGASTWSMMFIDVIGICGMVIVQLILRERFPRPENLRSAPIWAWCGGLITVIPTFAAMTLARKLGAGVFTAISITSALITSMLLDQFALVGFTQHSMNWQRIVGAGIMVCGFWLFAVN